MENTVKIARTKPNYEGFFFLCVCGEKEKLSRRESGIAKGG